MTLTRRSFLQSLTAAVAASSLPVVSAAGEASRGGVIRINGQRLILRKPIVVAKHHTFYLTNSYISVSDDFEGDSMLYFPDGMGNCAEAFIGNNRFDTCGKPIFIIKAG